MFRYDVITDEECNIELTALIEPGTGKRTMVAIEFKNLRCKDYPTQTLLWDNDDYIFNDLYEFLKRWEKDEVWIKDKEKFQDIWPILSNDLVKELVEMIEYALEEKWYEPETE